MTDYDNTNRGSIWKNDRKETDTQPDFTGSLDVDGVSYFVDAWRRKPDEANPKAPALRFKVKRKEQQNGNGPRQATARREAPKATAQDDFASDDIPFATNRGTF